MEFLKYIVYQILKILRRYPQVLYYLNKLFNRSGEEKVYGIFLHSVHQKRKGRLASQSKTRKLLSRWSGPQTNEDSTKMLSFLVLASPTPSAVFPFSNGQVDYKSKSRIRWCICYKVSPSTPPSPFKLSPIAVVCQPGGGGIMTSTVMHKQSKYICNKVVCKKKNK